MNAIFLNYAGLEECLTEFDACFFCLGIASAGMKKSDYECVTYGYTIAAAEILSRLNPGMTFIFISDSGADSTGKGRIMGPCQRPPRKRSSMHSKRRDIRGQQARSLTEQALACDVCLFFIDAQQESSCRWLENY